MDVIIYATGFDILGSTKQFELKTNKLDENGQQIDLGEIFGDSPQMYLSMAHENCPNYFRLYGPSSFLAHNSNLFMIECQVNYVCEVLVRMVNLNKRSFCLKEGKRKAYMKMVRSGFEGRNVSGGCVTWFQDKNGDNWTHWPGSVFSYWWLVLVCEKEDYRWE